MRSLNKSLGVTDFSAVDKLKKLNKKRLRGRKRGQPPSDRLSVLFLSNFRCSYWDLLCFISKYKFPHILLFFIVNNLPFFNSSFISSVSSNYRAVKSMEGIICP